MAGGGDNNEMDRPSHGSAAKPSGPSSNNSNNNSAASGSSSSSNAITQDDINRVKAELANNLEEESMLLSLQMQLTVQLEELKKAVSTAETEERLATLALQQAKVARLLQSGGTEEDEEELVTVKVQS